MDKIYDLSQEDVLHLTALREVIGGFTHEIAQPLNAIMIASQIVQLGVERSALSNEEKAFIIQRLEIVSSQVRRAGHIIDGIRKFIRGSSAQTANTDVAGVLESVCGLRGQQLSGRGIELVRQPDASVPTTPLELRTVECLVVNGLAFARDAVETIGRRHAEAGISFNKTLTVRLLADDGNCVFDIRWNIGDLSTEAHVEQPTDVFGLAAASSVLNSLGGRLETTAGAIVITFP